MLRDMRQLAGLDDLSNKGQDLKSCSKRSSVAIDRSWSNYQVKELTILKHVEKEPLGYYSRRLGADGRRAQFAGCNLLALS